MTDLLLLMFTAFMSMMAADKTGSEARFSPTTVVTTIQLALLKLPPDLCVRNRKLSAHYVVMCAVWRPTLIEIQVVVTFTCGLISSWGRLTSRPEWKAYTLDVFRNVPNTRSWILCRLSWIRQLEVQYYSLTCLLFYDDVGVQAEEPTKMSTLLIKLATNWHNKLRKWVWNSLINVNFIETLHLSKTKIVLC